MKTIIYSVWTTALSHPYVLVVCFFALLAAVIAAAAIETEGRYHR